MRLSQELNDAICAQIVHEYRNQLIYTQIACYFKDLGLNNLAKYFFDAASHEKDHAEKFINYLNDRIGGKVTIGSVPSPNLGLSSPSTVGEVYIKVEEETTLSIEDLMELVLEQKSYIDQSFILEMLKEQVEEEDSAKHFATLIKNVKDIVLFDATFGG